MLHISDNTHTHKHTQTRCTDLKRGGSVGVCRGETKDQTTECLCLLQLRGNRRSTLNIAIKTEMYPWKTSLKPPLFFLECHVGVNDSSLYMWCSVYITFLYTTAIHKQSIITQVGTRTEKNRVSVLSLLFQCILKYLSPLLNHVYRK